MTQSPFHHGELQIQERVGEDDIASRVGTIVKDFMPARALEFIAKQTMVIASSLDEGRNIWTSILVGRPGFVSAIDDRNIRIHLPSVVSSTSDVIWNNIEKEPKIGLLFIDLTTRKRLRVNGTLSKDHRDLHISVEQTYPNCPKYIQRRDIEVKPSHSESVNSIIRVSRLTTELKEWIRNSDTFFVGSSDGNKNLDASHRGGNPGFVEVLDDFTLKIPDYRGNSMFNTLGNFVINPKAGLLFVDFENGKTLQMTGEAEIVWDETDAENRTGGTNRSWKFRVAVCIQTDTLQGISWKLVDYSPFNPNQADALTMKGQKC